MNFHTIKPFMEHLSRCGLAVRIEGEIPVYRITDKGEEALGHLRRLEEMKGKIGLHGRICRRIRDNSYSGQDEHF